MTNKLVVIIKSLKVPKIKKVLLYEMKFLVQNYSCLQNSWLGGYRPQIPVLSVLCPTEFVEPSWTKFLGTPLVSTIVSEGHTTFHEAFSLDMWPLKMRPLFGFRILDIMHPMRAKYPRGMETLTALHIVKFSTFCENWRFVTTL